jgi:hypothetical protein
MTATKRNNNRNGNRKQGRRGRGRARSIKMKKSTRRYRGGGGCSVCESTDNIVAICAANHRICNTCVLTTVESIKCPFCRITILNQRTQIGDQEEIKGDPLLQELRAATARYKLAASGRDKGGLINQIARIFYR